MALRLQAAATHFAPDWTPPMNLLPFARPVLALSAAFLLLPAWAQAAGTEATRTLKFGDFFQQPIGPRGLDFTEQLRSADGQTVRLVGWMAAQETPSAGYFLLTPRPVRLSEHADGDADDLPAATVLVRLPEALAGQTPPRQEGLIELTGTLAVGRAVESDGRVSWVRLNWQP
jgi:hypothetical protein